MRYFINKRSFNSLNIALILNSITLSVMDWQSFQKTEW